MTTPEDKQVRANASFAASAQTLLGDWDQFLSEQALLARIKKATFDAYVKAGFTVDQAIQLCRG